MTILFTVISIAIAAIAAIIAYMQLRRTPKSASLDDNDAHVITAPSNTVRHNLPTPHETLIGRSVELARAHEGIGSEVTITSLEGLGGVGKTALAQEIAWRAVNTGFGRPFSTVVWAEDREGNLTLDRLMDIISETIGYPYLKTLKTHEKQAQVISQLGESPSLVIVDNHETIRDSRIVSFLRAIPSPQSKVLITTRERLYDDAWAVQVDGLPRPDADALLIQEATRLNARTVLNAPQALIAEFFEITEGNPLAILLSVGQAHQGVSSFSDTVARLQHTGSDQLLTAIFRGAWDRVLARDEDARRVLIVMAFNSASVSRAALEAGSNVHGDKLTDAIRRLVQLSLLDVYERPVSASFRYRIHALTRTFVLNQVKTDPVIRNDVEKRLIDYYLSFAIHHESTYSSLENIQALELEHVNLLAFSKRSYDRAAEDSEDQSWRSVIKYADALAAYLWGRGYWRDRLDLCSRAVRAAEALDDNVQVSRQEAMIGRVYLWLGDIESAKEHLRQSQLSVNDDSEDLVKAIPMRLSAQIASREGNYKLAQGLLEQVLKSAPLTVDDEGRAATLIELGVLAEGQQAWQEAKSYFEEALRLDEELDTVEGQAVSLSHLGNTQLAMKDYLGAERSFRLGLGLATRVDRLSTTGRCQYGLAQVYLATGDNNASKEHAIAAVESFTRLGMQDMATRAQVLSADSGGL